MNIPKEYHSDIIELKRKYSIIHNKLKELEIKIVNLINEKNLVLEELKLAREKEIDLINKIEEKIGRKITNEDLIKIE